jgi:hypothetical protein
MSTSTARRTLTGTVSVTKYLTDKDGKKIEGSDSNEGIKQQSIPGTYELFDTINALGFGLDIVGFSPVDGGDGRFAVAVTTPESSTIVLVGFGVLGLLWAARARRQGSFSAR